MNKEEKNQFRLRIVGYGCVFFIIISITAMFFYPGGTMVDSSTIGYIFHQNVLSDLGITISHSGESNLVSHALFSLAATVAGIGLIPFFITMPKYFKSNKWEKYISIIMSSFACFFALTYIGIAASPANLFNDLHLICVALSFLGTFPVILGYTVLMFLKKGIPRYLCYVFLFFTIISIAYIISGFVALNLSGETQLVFAAISQKIIIYTEMSVMVIVGPGMASYSKKISNQL